MSEYVVCCQCNKMVKLSGTNDWEPITEAHGSLEYVSHGYCPKCYKETAKKINDYFDGA